MNEVVRLFPPKFMIPDIQKTFTLLDYTAKGTLDSRDVKVTLRALGIEPTATKVRMLIDRTSVDKQSVLCLEEYESMMAHVINDVDSDEQMVRAFRALDMNARQMISFDDLKNVAQKLHLDVADEEIKEMIDFVDEDKDGNVSLEEFMDATRKIF